MHLSKKAMGVSSSITLSIDAKAKKLKAEGVDVISFGAGEPDFNTPQYIIAAAKEALDKGFTKYTPASGTTDLKQAICQKLKNDNGLDYKAEQIVVSNGAKHSLHNALQAILDPGDEVLIPSPYWLSYPELVKMAGGTPVFVHTKGERNFKIDVNDLKNSYTKKTKALIINSPNNPTGCVYSTDELKSIAEFAVQENIIVISDEIYEKLVYGGTKHVSIASIGPEIKDLTILVNGVSKAYAMTGWRIGYAAARDDISKAMSNMQSHSTSNPNSIAQYASTAALRSDKGEIYKMVKEFDARRSYMVERLNSIKGLSCSLPEGAFYVMMDISDAIGRKFEGKTINCSLDYSEMLLDSKKVATVPGIAFGIDSFVRLSYATSMESIQRGLERIEDFMNMLE